MFPLGFIFFLTIARANSAQCCSNFNCSENILVSKSGSGMICKPLCTGCALEDSSRSESDSANKVLRFSADDEPVTSGSDVSGCLQEEILLGSQLLPAMATGANRCVPSFLFAEEGYSRTDNNNLKN